MANLWRTQRPRFPLYQSDGLGRDYYIKFTNGGFWEDQFVLSKKPDYIRPKYNNFHSLFHMAAPFKYWGDGSGRENYILKCNGFIHDQKPLCSYTLTDFLRNGKKYMERAINENEIYDMFLNDDYVYLNSLADSNDLVHPILEFYDKSTENRTISALEWSIKYPELLLFLIFKIYLINPSIIINISILLQRFYICNINFILNITAILIII